MKIGILLTTPPSHENTHTVIHLTRSALKKGHTVSIFLMSDGVYNTHHSEFIKLIEEGAHISLCAYNSEQRCLERVEGILYGSQYDLASIAHEADRFLTFG
jgi:sulfur relay (sulfurtransferase) complex TusBCD TusD component (DsrE family)